MKAYESTMYVRYYLEVAQNPSTLTRMWAEYVLYIFFILMYIH